MPLRDAQALLTLFPSLASVTPSLDDLPADAGPLDVPSGTRLFAEHDPCQGFPLVLAGEVKVSRRSEDGREIELYRVTPGEFCLVSASSLFRGMPLLAQGSAADATRLVMVNPAVFRRWLENPAFRDVVFGVLAQRMVDLTELIDAIAFRRLDVRLADALLGHGPEQRVTHQALADRLGTVREIVTRLLRRFEKDGLVELHRERITVLDSAALRALAAGAPPPR